MSKTSSNLRKSGKSGQASEFSRQLGLSHPVRINDGKIDELEIRQNDIFLLDFFLHAYSLIKREGRNFQESKEGFTYMLQKIEE